MSQTPPPEPPVRGPDPPTPAGPPPELPDPLGVPPTTAEVAARRGFQLRGRSLREHVARGVIINAAFTIGLSTLGLVRGFVLAIFLTREDYGIWGILVVSLATLLWLKQVGIGDKFIQQDEEDQERAFQKAFTLELILTSCFMVLLAAALPLLAVAYDQNDLVAPGLVLLAVLPAGVLQMPLWAYSRRMEFMRQRTLMAVDPIVGFLVSVALAVAGAGYWALAGGVVAGGWAAAAAALVWSPYRLRLRYDKGTLRSYASFSWPLLVTSLAGLLVAQGAVLATNAVLGLAAAGVVTLAATITQYTERVDQLVTGTLYPAICAVRNRIDLLHESFVKSNRLALIWAVPFGTGLTLFCSDLVTYGIGEEWRPAVIVLQFFGVAAAINQLGFNWDAYFRAIGQTRPMAAASVGAAVAFLAVLLPLLESRGLEGLAIAILVQGFVHLGFRAYFLRRLFKGFAFLPHAARAIAPTVPAVAAVLAVRLADSGPRSGALAAVELTLYVGLVTAATLLVEGRLLREMVGYLRQQETAGAASR